MAAAALAAPRRNHLNLPALPCCCCCCCEMGRAAAGSPAALLRLLDAADLASSEGAPGSNSRYFRRELWRARKVCQVGVDDVRGTVDGDGCGCGYLEELHEPGDVARADLSRAGGRLCDPPLDVEPIVLQSQKVK